MVKTYDIFLDENRIGTTELENADAPMGVAFGQIKFIDIISGYIFFKEYCLKNRIDFRDYTEDNFIATNNIPNLKIADKNGVEIKRIGITISGMDSNHFDITILGISYPFYEDEFPDHVKTYKEMFE